MNREATLRAIDEAFVDGVKHLYGPLVSGLETNQPPDDLIAKFRSALGFHCDAHAKAKAVIDRYFTGGQ
jgi:hypothetical protein